MNFDSWDCPSCGYKITDTELQACCFDFGCPKCKKPLGDFKPRPEIKEKIWISHPESECIFIGTHDDLEHDPLCCELGPVVLGDLDEIVILLKGLGWSASDVLSTKIVVKRSNHEF